MDEFEIAAILEAGLDPLDEQIREDLDFAKWELALLSDVERRRRTR